MHCPLASWTGTWQSTLHCKVEVLGSYMAEWSHVIVHSDWRCAFTSKYMYHLCCVRGDAPSLSWAMWYWPSNLWQHAVHLGCSHWSVLPLGKWGMLHKIGWETWLDHSTHVGMCTFHSCEIMCTTVKYMPYMSYHGVICTHCKCVEMSGMCIVRSVMTEQFMCHQRQECSYSGGQFTHALWRQQMGIVRVVIMEWWTVNRHQCLSTV